MKKKIIALMAITAILASNAAVFADTTPTATPAVDETINVPAQPDTEFETEIQGDIMLISTETEDVPATMYTPEDAEIQGDVMVIEGEAEIAAPVVMPSYISNTVTVTEVGEGTIASKTDSEAETESELENVINFTTDETTLVFSANGEKKSLEYVKKDSVITVFTSSYAAVPMILPPQYPANVIVINDEETVSNVNVDTYLEDGEMLLSAGNSLALNIADTTEIIDVNGEKVEADTLANKDLIVFYTMSTRSLPPQTTPEKVVVLGENEMALASIEASKNEETATPAPEATPEATTEPVVIKAVQIGDKKIENVYAEADAFMVPLREIAETLGFTVEWNGETREVILNGGIYSLKIDENSYAKGKMMPVELKSAPVIKDDLTFVPVEYFTEVLEVSSGINEGTIVFENIAE